MNIDKDTVLTIIFTLIDDCMKSPNIQKHLKRPGPAPDMTDAEVVTLATYQELIGEPREDHFYRLHRPQLWSFFPCLNERSRYNRRKRDLHQIILAVRVALGVIFDLSRGQTATIDSAPVPVVGYKRDKRRSRFPDAAYGFCSSKALKYFGFKFHSLVNLTGSVVDFVLTAAAPYDDQVVEEFLDLHQDQIRLLLGDKAYVAQDLKTLLRESMGILLFTPKKANAKTTTQHLTKTMAQLRLLGETVNAQLQEQLHLSKHYAKSQWGLMTRVAAKLTAHTVGQIVNQLLGRPQLALAGLAV